MTTSTSPGQMNDEDFLNWLEQDPGLTKLRAMAAGVVCEYKPGEANPQSRIRCNPPKELEVAKKGPLRWIWNTVWVPGRNMRGVAYGTPELDKSLNSVAKLMCISTLWDFVCTIPLFQFSLAPLAAGALPGATLLSFVLLLASNVAGETATDRRPGHAAKASWSLAAFVLLCTAKTLFSGVGVDLMIGSQAVASNYAASLSKEKLAKDKAELKRLEGGDAVCSNGHGCARVGQGADGPHAHAVPTPCCLRAVVLCVHCAKVQLHATAAELWNGAPDSNVHVATNESNSANAECCQVVPEFPAAPAGNLCAPVVQVAHDDRCLQPCGFSFSEPHSAWQDS